MELIFGRSTPLRPESSISNRPAPAKKAKCAHSKIGHFVKTLAKRSAVDGGMSPAGAATQQRLFPQHQTIVVQGIGHLPMLEAPRKTAHDFLKFAQAQVGLPHLGRHGQHRVTHGERRRAWEGECVSLHLLPDSQRICLRIPGKVGCQGQGGGGYVLCRWSCFSDCECHLSNLDLDRVRALTILCAAPAALGRGKAIPTTVSDCC